MSDASLPVALHRVLVEAVGPDHVLTDADRTAGYAVDWTRRFAGPVAAVVRPGTTAEVGAVLAACHQAGHPVVPQGGNTGLVGGGVPEQRGPAPVLVSCRRLDGLRDLDLAQGQAIVEAGVTLGALQSRLVQSGWEFGIDLAARDSATIGGMVATNAGGTRVLRYGAMRANVLGLEMVLADGRVLSHLAGLRKDNTGYDLTGLWCGSEGTLGIVTAACLRLVPAWPDRLGVAVACTGWAEAVELAGRARREVDGLDAVEAFDARGAALVASSLGVRLPLGVVPVTLCLVWAGRGDPPDALQTVVDDRPHFVASPRDVLEPRDRQTEAIAGQGIPHKLDVTLPLSHLAGFAEAVTEALAPWAVYLFGHLGDGNLHVNVIGPDPDDDRVDARVLELVAAVGGSISAEHGIGRAKRRWLHLSREAGELATMTAIKRALDPYGIMNPGVIFDDGRS